MLPYPTRGQNFSRDWVIEKLTFRVAFDTDVGIQAVPKPLTANPEAAPSA